MISERTSEPAQDIAFARSLTPQLDSIYRRKQFG